MPFPSRVAAESPRLFARAVERSALAPSWGVGGRGGRKRDNKGGLCGRRFPRGEEGAPCPEVSHDGLSCQGSSNPRRLQPEIPEPLPRGGSARGQVSVGCGNAEHTRSSTVEWGPALFPAK